MASQPDIVISPLGWNRQAGYKEQLRLLHAREFEEPLRVLAQLVDFDEEAARRLKEEVTSVFLDRESERWEAPMLEFERALGLRPHQRESPLLGRMVVWTYMREGLKEMSAADFPQAESLDLWLQKQITQALAKSLGTRAGWNPLKHLRRVLASKDYRRLRSALTPAQAEWLGENNGLTNMIVEAWELVLAQQRVLTPQEFLEAERIRTAFTPLALALVDKALASANV
jgi:hypothetical protein